MNIKVEPSKEYTIVSVEGRIDTTTAGEFEKPMMKIIDEGCTKIILDCSGLIYISSSGLRVFLMVLKKMLAVNGKFNICNLQPGIKEIFDISGFSNIFTLFTDKEAAILAI